MISTKLLKGVMSEARPIIERMLDDAELIAGMRDVIADNGGDWASLKALIKAQIQDERDEAGGNKRVQKILDRADYSAAYADMLGLGNVTEKNISADEPFDPETGEITEIPAGSHAQPHDLSAGPRDAPAQPGSKPEAVASASGPIQTPVAQRSEPSAHNGFAASSNLAGRSTLDDIPPFLDRRSKGPPQTVA